MKTGHGNDMEKRKAREAMFNLSKKASDLNENRQ
jgi:hypothetical protein